MKKITSFVKKALAYIDQSADDLTAKYWNRPFMLFLIMAIAALAMAAYTISLFFSPLWRSLCEIPLALWFVHILRHAGWRFVNWFHDESD